MVQALIENSCFVCQVLLYDCDTDIICVTNILIWTISTLITVLYFRKCVLKTVAANLPFMILIMIVQSKTLINNI